MDKRIILTSLLVAFIFSSFIIYSSFAQTTNLPICITPEKYLAWPNFVKYNVPVASTTPGFLTVSPIYVSSTNVGIGTNNPQAKLHVVGNILSTGNYIFQTGSDTWRGGLYGYGTSSVTIFGLTQQGIRVDLYSISPWQWLSRGDIYVRNVNASNDVIADRFCIGTNCINQWPSQVAQYWTLSGNNLYTSSTNWNVGIGTNNPSERLHVEGTIRTRNLRLGNVDTTNKYDYIRIFSDQGGGYIGGLMYSSSSFFGVNSFTIYSTDNRNIILYPGSGNVGIGTNNPQYKLQVVSGSGRWTAINADGSIVVNRDGAPPYILFQGSGGGISYIYNPSEGTTGRAMAFYTQADGQNYSEKVRITGAGNVGIGTTNPQAKLEVAGAIRLTPQTATPTPIAGTMYFDQNSGVFKCYQKTGVDRNNNPIYDWVDCAGAPTRPSEGLVIPVVIKDSAGNVVLEINQE